MQTYLTAARMWLEAELHPTAPWALLTVGIWLAVYIVRRFWPWAWESMAAWGPDKHRASQVFQALPAVLVGVIWTTYATGGNLAEAWKGAVAGAVAPLVHHFLKWVPGAYVGGSWPAATKSKRKRPPPAKPPGPPAFVCLLLTLTFCGCGAAYQPACTPEDEAAIDRWYIQAVADCGTSAACKARVDLEYEQRNDAFVRCAKGAS